MIAGEVVFLPDMVLMIPGEPHRYLPCEDDFESMGDSERERVDYWAPVTLRKAANRDWCYGKTDAW
jgi:hypothetical protein